MWELAPTITITITIIEERLSDDAGSSFYDRINRYMPVRYLNPVFEDALFIASYLSLCLDLIPFQKGLFAQT